MKFYLAGKCSEKETIRRIIAELEAMGHSVTHDWTQRVQVPGEIDPHRGREYVPDEEEPTWLLGRSAELDIEGIREADFAIFLMTDPEYAYRGTFTELGCALGLQKPCLILCPFVKGYCQSNCFYYHPAITHVSSEQEMREWVNSLAF